MYEVHEFAIKAILKTLTTLFMFFLFAVATIAQKKTGSKWRKPLIIFI